LYFIIQHHILKSIAANDVVVSMKETNSRGEEAFILKHQRFFIHDDVKTEDVASNYKSTYLKNNKYKS
jgi:hypothetical protein